MPTCSQPGCGELSAGRVLSPGTRVNKRPEHVVATEPLRPAGEICLEHLRAWFPDRDDDWLVDWLGRQHDAAKAIHEVDEKAADKRFSMGFDKIRRLARGIIIR